jgi:Flp pilus assembly pilin Flp
VGGGGPGHDRALRLPDLPAQPALGQSTVEYGLLIATIGIVTLIGVGTFGELVSAWFGSLVGRVTGA